MTSPDEPVREDFLDFPTAWRIQERTVEHHPECSSRPEWRLLCDCGSVQAEWERRVAAQQEARGANRGSSSESIKAADLTPPGVQ